MQARSGSVRALVAGCSTMRSKTIDRSSLMCVLWPCFCPTCAVHRAIGAMLLQALVAATAADCWFLKRCCHLYMVIRGGVVGKRGLKGCTNTKHRNLSGLSHKSVYASQPVWSVLQSWFVLGFAWKANGFFRIYFTSFAPCTFDNSIENHSIAIKQFPSTNHTKWSLQMCKSTLDLAPYWSVWYPSVVVYVWLKGLRQRDASSRVAFIYVHHHGQTVKRVRFFGGLQFFFPTSR